MYSKDALSRLRATQCNDEINFYPGPESAVIVTGIRLIPSLNNRVQEGCKYFFSTRKKILKLS